MSMDMYSKLEERLFRLERYERAKYRRRMRVGRFIQSVLLVASGMVLAVGLVRLMG